MITNHNLNTDRSAIKHNIHNVFKVVGKLGTVGHTQQTMATMLVHTHVNSVELVHEGNAEKVPVFRWQN
jgi:hypothetical protein